MAIVLPSREDLGTIFRHFIDNKIPLQGASDHGYSEAIYLADTEGNGVEIYRDLPQDTWDVRPDGRIVGITEPMDAETIYALGKKADAAYQMPAGSRMGHVHLSVRESAASSRFYQEVLAVEDKFSVPSAAWLASGDYHHHLAVNEWGGKNLKTRQEGMPGLAYYTVIYSNPEAFEATLNRAIVANLNLHRLDNSALPVIFIIISILSLNSIQIFLISFSLHQGFSIFHSSSCWRFCSLKWIWTTKFTPLKFTKIVVWQYLKTFYIV